MSDEAFQHLTAENRDGVTVVQFRVGRLLDEITIRDVGRELGKLAERDSPRLLLQLSNVEYLASAMLGKLITLQRKVLERKGRLAFCSITPNASDTFRVSRLDGYFNIYHSLPEALEALRASS